jgi:hypothetical protein
MPPAHPPRLNCNLSRSLKTAKGPRSGVVGLLASKCSKTVDVDLELTTVIPRMTSVA